jgi:hypothetical protein
MRATYVPISQKEWEFRFLQKGGFIGRPYQRGGGLGGIFRALFRAILPIAKTAGKFVGKTMLRSGADVATDLLEGQNAKASFKRRGRQAAGDLMQEAANKMKGGKRRKKRRCVTQLGTVYM